MISRQDQQSEPLRFVILASMRTGSNLLNAHLNQFDGVVCHGEAFNNVFVGLKADYYQKLGMTRDDLGCRDEDPFAFKARLFDDPAARAVGFHIFPGHNREILQSVLDDRGVKKIVLRRSLIQSFVSLCLARETGVWLVSVDRPEAKQKLENTRRKILFVPSEFEVYRQQLNSFWHQVLSALKESGQEFHPIWFSGVNDVEEVNAVARFIGLSEQKTELQQKLVRQNPADLRGKVENWEELEEYALSNGYEAQLY